jgi:hypothetical protein
VFRRRWKLRATSCESRATHLRGGAAQCSRLETSSDSGISFLFGLAPCGVCHARDITAAAVRSYRTFSPLPRRCRRGGMFSVALSVELPTLNFVKSTKFRMGHPPGRYPAHCSAEFGLSSPCRPKAPESGRPVRLPTESLYWMYSEKQTRCLNSLRLGWLLLDFKFRHNLSDVVEFFAICLQF